MADPAVGMKLIDALELLPKLVLIEGDGNAVAAEESAGGGELMVVARLAEVTAAWHDEEGLAELESGENRAGPGVGDEDGRFLHDLAEARRGHETLPSDRGGLECGGANLCEHIVAARVARPLIDAPNKAIERHLCADGHEDHKTAPE